MPVLLNRFKRQLKKGMTVLEIMLAVMIFSLITVAVFSVFRTALRSLRIFDRDSQVLQTTRVTFDLINSDLRSVYYAPPWQYDRNNRVELDRARSTFVAGEGQGRLSEEGFDPFGAYNDRGMAISLNFKGQNKGGKDEISFTRYYPGGWEPVNSPWNFALVKYSVEGGDLFRTEDNVIQTAFDFWGERLERRPPPKELIARNVVSFNLQYGYFFEGQWQKSDEWDSQEERFRNPFYQLQQLDDPTLETQISINRNIPIDSLPAFVDVTLGIRDYADTGKVRFFNSRVFIPSSLETYRDLTEEELEAFMNPGMF